jgi:hypothetical protein
VSHQKLIQFSQQVGQFALQLIWIRKFRESWRLQRQVFALNQMTPQRSSQHFGQ